MPTERIPRDKPPNLARRGEIVTKTQKPFDSRWVPPVGGAPSRRTGTGEVQRMGYTPSA